MLTNVYLINLISMYIYKLVCVYQSEMLFLCSLNGLIYVVSFHSIQMSKRKSRWQWGLYVVIGCCWRKKWIAVVWNEGTVKRQSNLLSWNWERKEEAQCDFWMLAYGDYVLVGCVWSLDKILIKGKIWDLWEGRRGVKDIEGLVYIFIRMMV